MATFIGTLLAGLSAGSIYALVALGFGLLFQSAQVIDFARGALVVTGSLVAYWVEVTLGLPAIAALPVCAATGLVLGAVQFGLCAAPLPARGRVAASLVATLGFGIVVTAALAVTAGTGSRIVAAPLLSDASVHVGGVVVSAGDAVIVAAAVLLTCVISWVVRTTRTGRELRAVAEDGEAAAVRGINVRLHAIGSFAIAGALATITGFLIAPLRVIDIAYAPLFTIYGFVAMIVGGSASPFGALLGGWIIGMTEALGTTYLHDINAKNLFGLAVLLIALLLRPQGIFASAGLRRA